MFEVERSSRSLRGETCGGSGGCPGVHPSTLRRHLEAPEPRDGRRDRLIPTDDNRPHFHSLSRGYADAIVNVRGFLRPGGPVIGGLSGPLLLSTR